MSPMHRMMQAEVRRFQKHQTPKTLNRFFSTEDGVQTLLGGQDGGLVSILLFPKKPHNSPSYPSY